MYDIDFPLYFLTLPATLSGMNGAQIRAARERRGWTQAELATAVGVGQRTVGNWERGESIPKNRMAMLEHLFGDDNGQNGNGEPTTMRSDADLLAEASQILSELTRRALRRTS